MEIAEPSPEFYEFVRHTVTNDDEVRANINNMEISADAKAMLYAFSKTTLKIGHAIVKIGRKILDFIFVLMRAFPNISFAIILALVLSALVASIPLLGAIFGTMAAKLLLLVGVIKGAEQDFLSGDMENRIHSLVDHFAPLQA
ncbi:hypothetical protein [Undibacterium fentianense]|uniref:Uncharacterized protein n=1 Tax=Undibacterium fentianense TaxID=2828728 RepID=A0A941IE38_9BURK|nr:hypothetical protein [Undibacterium fentianense]MBR7799007.1 hypothetical protein [Undibacterium fentianense]